MDWSQVNKANFNKHLAAQSGTVMGKALPILGGALDYAGGKAVGEDDFRAGVGAAGSTAGSIAGAALGATVGSVVPIVGTGLGGLVGGMAGNFLGGWLADRGDELLRGKKFNTTYDAKDVARTAGTQIINSYANSLPMPKTAQTLAVGTTGYNLAQGINDNDNVDFGDRSLNDGWKQLKSKHKAEREEFERRFGR